MSRYIDADVVNIDELCRLRSNLRTGLYVGYTLNTQRQINRFIKALDEIIDSCTPTIEERPKGKWSEHEDYCGDTYYTCSNCGGDWCIIEGTPVDNMMNYCPNCGADMRGDV